MHTLKIKETYSSGEERTYTHRLLFKWLKPLYIWWYKLCEDDYMGESPVHTKIEIDGND